MKIGMVTAVYKPVVNGVTHMVSLYKQHLQALGHEVTVFTLGDPDPAGDEPGVVRSPAIPLKNYGYYLSMGYSKHAQDLLREMDILHCHHLAMSVDMAHRYAHCPIVYTNHTRYDLYTGAYIPLPQPAADAIMRQIWPEYTDLADVVITPSESMRQVMLDFGVRRPLVVIENGIELRPFLTPQNPRTKADLGVPETAVLCIYIGRLNQEKNLNVLLEQFTIARQIVPELHLMLVGKGPLRDDLPDTAAALGIADSVHLAGAVDYADIPGYLCAADLFVTASVTEVHPLTLIEAMAAGLPVAASRSPGISDTVIHGKSGLLANEPHSGLAAAIAALAFDPARRREMGAAARRASRRYGIGRTVARTLELYERLRLERPDLDRERLHGRWYQVRSSMWPKLEQLARIIRPPGTAWR